MENLVSPVNLGEKDISIAIGGFVVTETVRPPGFVIPPHCHEHTNISFALCGSFIETIGRQSFELKPGSIVVRPAGEVHRNQYGKDQARSLIVEVGKGRAEMIRENSKLLDRAEHFTDGAMSNFVLRIRREFRQMDAAAPLVIEGLILEMVARGVRQESGHFTKKKPLWLLRARDFVHANFLQPVNLFEIAEIAGVHPSHLVKTFRLHYRCTLGEYVRRLRLDYAEQELKDSDKSLSEIALEAGFYDQSHLTNVFKLRSGITPSEFRALARREKFP